MGSEDRPEHLESHSSETAATSHPERPHYSTHQRNVTKPLGFFHPTHAEFEPSEAKRASFSWDSRTSRKNRVAPTRFHLRHHSGSMDSKDKEATTVKAMSVRSVSVEQRLRHPHTHLKVHLTWDISFWVAVVFVLGSAAWVSLSQCFTLR